MDKILEAGRMAPSAGNRQPWHFIVITDDEVKHELSKGLFSRFLKDAPFEWKGPTEFNELMNNADPLTHVIVLLVDCTEGSEVCTEVHLIHSGWRSSAAWEEARKYFERAWKDALKKLRAVMIEKGQQSSLMFGSYIV